jgi:hypothetical protein
MLVLAQSWPDVVGRAPDPAKTGARDPADR